MSCIACKLHFHIDCKGYEKKYFLMDTERRLQWQCDICLRKSYKSKNAPVPVSPILVHGSPAKRVIESAESCVKSTNPLEAPDLDTCDDDEVVDLYQNVTLRGKKQRTHSDDECSAQGESALEITNALKEYVADQMSHFTHQLLTKIDTLGSTIQSFNSRCDNIEMRIAKIEKRLDEKVDEKVNDLMLTVNRLQCDLNDKCLDEKVDNKVSDLMLTVNRLQCDLNDREQELLVNEVEISGVPEANGENSVHVVTVIANKLGVKISESDVVSAVRIGARRESAAGVRVPPAHPATHGPPVSGAAAPAVYETGPRLLVVRVLRRAQRDELLRAARVRRGADTAGLGLPGPVRRFYVNERLTRVNRELFRRAREETRRLQWKFVWTRGGAILVRRENGETAMRIRTEVDLVKVFGAGPVSAV